MRPATLEDLPALIALGERMHAESPRFSKLPFSAKQMGLTFYQLITQPLGFVQVLEKDGRVVGTLAAFCGQHYFSEGLAANDVGLYIEPEHRGGAGVIRLVRAYVAWAKEQGAVLIQMGISSGIHAETTDALLQKLGFTSFGTLLEV